MNNSTIEELRATHERLGKLIAEISADDSHKKLMSLIGVCYVRHSGNGFSAHKINKIDVTQRSDGGVVVIVQDNVSVSMSDKALTVYVADNLPTHYDLRDALVLADLKNVDIMKSSQFDHLKRVAEHRKQYVWEQLCAEAV